MIGGKPVGSVARVTAYPWTALVGATVHRGRLFVCLLAQVVSRLETHDHWITYCEAEDGSVADTDKKTAVHRRKVANYY
jgi:flavin reductase (DIM6/NTAB) family NADH-FMN oxidoreductase RutF